MDREDARQLFHMAIGLGALAALLLFGRGVLMAAVFFTILLGLLLINMRLQGAKLFFITWFEERFERPDAPLPGWGSACYAAGALIALTFLQDVPEIASVIFILGIGDGVSTLAGRRGKTRMPYNPKKTAEGSIAMLLASLPAYYFIGPLAIPLAIAGALAESLPVVDDNLSIPIACTALLLLIP